jgi:hypothetical protein
MTYEILNHGKAIKCLRCNRISHNPNDIRERYCANCHVFHEDLSDFEESHAIYEQKKKEGVL